MALAIARAAGDELIKESEEIGYVPISEFAITSAGNLLDEKAFHIPTICYRKGQKANLSEINKFCIGHLLKCRRWVIKV